MFTLLNATGNEFNCPTPIIKERQLIDARSGAQGKA